MPLLTNLDVRIGHVDGVLYHIAAKDEERILEPLYDVRRPERFRLYVTWHLAMGEESRKDTPFTEVARGLNL